MLSFSLQSRIKVRSASSPPWVCLVSPSLLWVPIRFAAFAKESLRIPGRRRSSPFDRFRKFLVRTRPKRPSSLSAPNLQPKGSCVGTSPPPQPPHGEKRYELRPRESNGEWWCLDGISPGESRREKIPARLSSIADFLLLSSSPRRCEVMTDWTAGSSISFYPLPDGISGMLLSVADRWLQYWWCSILLSDVAISFSLMGCHRLDVVNEITILPMILFNAAAVVVDVVVMLNPIRCSSSFPFFYAVHEWKILNSFNLFLIGDSLQFATKSSKMFFFQSSKRKWICVQLLFYNSHDVYSSLPAKTKCSFSLSFTTEENFHPT